MRQKTKTRRQAHENPSETGATLCHADKAGFSVHRHSKRIGFLFESRALIYLQRQRMICVARNVSCPSGELDLVMQDAEGVLVFVEVRARMGDRYGGALASVNWLKRQRLIGAARHFLATSGQTAQVCRFDIVAFDKSGMTWLRDAFRIDEAED